METPRFEDYKVTDEFVCPFCGGDCLVLSPPAVVHSDPACVVFMGAEVVEFLHLVNDARRRLN